MKIKGNSKHTEKLFKTNLSFETFHSSGGVTDGFVIQTKCVHVLFVGSCCDVLRCKTVLRCIYFFVEKHFTFNSWSPLLKDKIN